MCFFLWKYKKKNYILVLGAEKMNIKRQFLFDKIQTGIEMKRLVFKHASDLQQYIDYSPQQFYDLVKNLDYKRDKKGYELVSRPLYSMRLGKIYGIDCKKKSILIASYAFLKKIPFRFIASSNRPDKKIHHVYPQLFLNNQWIDYDATYKKNKIGELKILTKKEIL